jgi:hypothetical protein
MLLEQNWKIAKNNYFERNSLIFVTKYKQNDG